ncbi:CDP-6-deoxy-D-xylo-4-hexulose-3-dehydrase [Parasporobacterium paucivorans DSM 15970]|uniref:CDP-6-deoxy-D-xylo-4-hexulose-3-dehydrase n=2 Tax=Parasporobacterium TaxID=115543 RepID=A0A1M6GVQ3_9FIRM|nr:lipopolysaccharide biosynthesis protein RfbH [Parasporobacterium paucivorans]SHJ14037.1 CDP-6-deoxy-D-xylo-4-hexulose-3-dehydrase [Parasporobacterium paucivorans DSM 15970]
MGADHLRKEIIELTKKYYQEEFANHKEFSPGDRINYSGRVFDEDELVYLVQASLDFWLTTGHYADEFEQNLAGFLGLKYASLVNSGSSANLLAFMALTAPELGVRRIEVGDEVITVAAGFPTTVTPIIQYGAVPVFLDVTIPQYNVDVSKLEKALSNRTKAVFLAHTLGNPFDLKTVKEFCTQNGLWLIEDNCDALGSVYCMDGECKKTGTFGDLSTYSFYPPHHITLGEGGAVCTDNPLLNRLVNSYRDWGRDCWCKSGVDNTCGRRHAGRFGQLPEGYDHKYVYSHFGYNLKATDLQASIGCAQMKKLPGFIEARKKNWNKLRQELEIVSDKIILPETASNSDPSWFGFLMTVKENAGFARNELAKHLEERNIQTRYLFAGNFLKQPCFDAMRDGNGGYRVVDTLENTDRIMSDSLWIGVYPGMDDRKLDFMVQSILGFIHSR